MRLTSKFKGITNVNSVTKVEKPWRAEIRPQGGYVRQLGSFETEEKAVDAYNQAAINLNVETHFFTRVEYVE